MAAGEGGSSQTRGCDDGRTSFQGRSSPPLQREGFLSRLRLLSSEAPAEALLLQQSLPGERLGDVLHSPLSSSQLLHLFSSLGPLDWTDPERLEESLHPSSQSVGDPSALPSKLSWLAGVDVIVMSSSESYSTLISKLSGLRQRERLPGPSSSPAASRGTVLLWRGLCLAQLHRSDLSSTPRLVITSKFSFRLRAL